MLARRQSAAPAARKGGVANLRYLPGWMRLPTGALGSHVHRRGNLAGGSPTWQSGLPAPIAQQLATPEAVQAERILLSGQYRADVCQSRAANNAAPSRWAQRLATPTRTWRQRSRPVQRQPRRITTVCRVSGSILPRTGPIGRARQFQPRHSPNVQAGGGKPPC